LPDPGRETGKVKIDMKKEEEDGGPVITNTYQLAIQPLEPPAPAWEDDRMIQVTHIFELHGKPAVAMKTRWLPGRDHFFKVFELVDAGEAYKHKWREVTNFGDYALFLGTTGSKTVHVSSTGHHGLKRNHIFFFFFLKLRETTSTTSSLPTQV
jgi:hypothetical protein